MGQSKPGCTAWSVDTVNAQVHQLIDGQVLHAAGLQLADVFGRDAMNAHGDELIRLRVRITELLHGTDEIRRNAVDPEGNQLVQRSEEHTSELQSLTNLVCRL